MLVPLIKKCFRNPFFGHFNPHKEYGRPCHRYFGKVNFFWVIWITKRCQKTRFLFRGALKAPLLVGLIRTIFCTLAAIANTSQVFQKCHLKQRKMTKLPFIKNLLYFYFRYFLISRIVQWPYCQCCELQLRPSCSCCLTAPHNHRKT